MRNTIPSYGRKKAEVYADIGLNNFSANVPLGNTDPTVVYGKLYGGLPNRSRQARGPLRIQRGKFT